jgi:(E)-4-hydroxy-3-methylbut-2-enyl-diphosphate synthase
VIELARAGSEIVRVTVNDEAAAAPCPPCASGWTCSATPLPLVGDFHYNGHRLLAAVPALGPSLAKLRINPGNVGFGDKRDRQFEAMIEAALRHDRPVRIGVNWGSLDQALAARLMDENARKPVPETADFVLREALVRSALESAAHAERMGLGADRIVVSAKVTAFRTSSPSSRAGAAKPLRAALGLTEAGMARRASQPRRRPLRAPMADGTANHRCSLAPRPGEARTTESGLPGILQS